MTDFKRHGVAEILKSISAIKDPKVKQDELGRCAGNQAIIAVLHAMFHPDVKFILPEGVPPFKKMEKSVDAQGALFREAKKLYIFIEGLSNPNIPPLKVQALFIQLLEALDPDDADLVVAMKEKRSPYPGLTYDLVFNTFPGLLPQNDAQTAHDQAQVVLEKKARPSGLTARKACPHGCINTSSDDGKWSPGPLANHIKKNHPSG